MSDPLILGFDTSAAHCAAALLSGDRCLVRRGEEMGRGQAERLMPLLEEVLAAAGAEWRDLERIGVGIGPGNFTGIRISVAAARGLALALDIPAIGVSTLDATDGTCPIVPAPREQVYLRGADGAIALVPRDTALGDATYPPPPDALAEAIARRARLLLAPGPSPAPLYVRPADAAPAREAPPRILDDA
ncbi:tRNA threonylcarbamoyladenosine biosynthesis protein TsaB [Roseivivax jejudonensis]|uniref:tRNA threonylcarbamoyladenosine biosynthesis protein TsaB n=1 Tax=Roseivivax jejudonensis TaxID=1529041 RepID=A0A1X6YAA3_9RHOB|nr:tRNA (adenosine(37)-N6)-threonylcarbamoyltransferase complex dimerization subunit type 1 TsaB [Roseivivax jejudonensis]SLN14997.1 tRNA threonylcarbamoyladenosine biosynthesis protein TsaB [Roseivivax jejudonensis]